MSEKQTTETNGSGEGGEVAGEKAGNVMEQIRAAWEKGGKKPPSADDADKLLERYKKGQLTVAAAEKALLDARNEEAGAVLALAAAFGGRSLSIEGVLHDFVARKGKVYLRRRTKDGEVFELG